MRPILLAALMVGGCATYDTAAMGDATLARLPQSEKDQLLDARKAVDVAQSDVTASQLSMRQATEFCHVAKVEFNAAKSRAEAGDVSAGDPSGQQAAQELGAASAKKAYCSALVEARNAKVGESRAAFAVAKTGEQLLQVVVLEQHGMAAGADPSAYREAKQKADETLARKRLEVFQRDGQASSLHATWDERRRTADHAFCKISTSVTAAPQ